MRVRYIKLGPRFNKSTNVPSEAEQQPGGRIRSADKPGQSSGADLEEGPHAMLSLAVDREVAPVDLRKV